MSIEIVLPQLGVEMSSAILAEWTVRDGDDVAQDEVVAIVETDKVSYEITASAAGVVHRIAREGDEYPVGAVLATVGRSGEAAEAPPEPAALSEPAAPAATRPAPTPARVVEHPAAGPGAPVLATPLARRIAAKAGLGLAGISATGRRGQITRSDVDAALAAAEPSTAVPAGPPAAADATGVPLTPLRRTIAQRMLNSLQTTAQMTDVREIDVSATLELRRAMVAQAEDLGFRPSINALFLKATALALRAVPELNATFSGGRLHRHRQIDVGMAVSVPDGLVVPVIRHADQLSLRELQEEVARLSGLARDRKLPAEDLAAGTFTMTNIGTYGSHFGTPVLNPPQVAVLAAGAVLERPLVRDGAMVVGEVAHFSLTVDHQIVDGETIGRFQQELTRILSAPYRLLVG